MSVVQKLSKALHYHQNGGESKANAVPSPIKSHELSPGSPGSPKLRTMAAIFQEKEYVSSSEDYSDLDNPGSPSKNAQKRQARRQHRESRSKLILEQRKESQERFNRKLEDASKEETEEMRSCYGELPLVQSTDRSSEPRAHFQDVSPEMVGQEVVFRARIQHVRRMGPRLVFFIFSQQINTMQGVLVDAPNKTSIAMLHWAEHVPTGSIVRVTGTVQKPEALVKSATLHELEVRITKLNTIVRRAEPGKTVLTIEKPFTVSPDRSSALLGPRSRA
jgi:ergosteryl-3beta-O-L-aspartate synthase